MRIKFLFLSLLSAALLSAQPAKDAVLKKIAEGAYAEKTLPLFRARADGESYTCLTNDKSMIVALSYKTGKPVDTLFNARKARECSFNDIEGYEVSPDGYHIVVWRNSKPLYGNAFTADYYDFDVRRNFITPLSDTDGVLRAPLFSPDGRMCAYVKDNNIWLRKFDFSTESAVTKDGKADSVLNGCSDRLYAETFGEQPMMVWSADSKMLTFIKLDISEVGLLDYQTFDDGAYPKTQSIKYSLAGSANPKATVHSYSVDTRDIKDLKMPTNGDYVPKLCDTKHSDQTVVMAFNRVQNVFQIHYVNPKSGVSRLILREESPTYIEPSILNSIEFLPDGFTLMSDRDGYSHLYLYSPTGALTRQITSGRWDVTAYRGIDATSKTVYYESAEEGSAYRSVYKIDAKGTKTKLSTQKGVNCAEFAAGFRYFIESYSSLNSPAVVSVRDANGKEVRVIDDNSSLKSSLANSGLPLKELITIPNSLGDELNGWVLKPAGFDTSKKYPVVVMQHPEPGTQLVLDKYSFGEEYFLASKGYVVLAVDPRGTGGKGTEFGKSHYRQLGLNEADDLLDVGLYLQKQSFVDPARLSIMGQGYGGFTALMAMSRGKKVYRSAVAVSPITDWKLYNSAFIERYMLTPGENPGGYNSCSPARVADKVEGAICVIQPSLDEKTHPQNAYLYAKALEEAGKYYNMMVLVGKSHEINEVRPRCNLYQSIVRFLETGY